MPLTPRRLLRKALAAIGVVVGGCDDGWVISRVNDYGLSRSWVAASGRDGLPVEVHGAPFSGVSAEQVIARLAFPPGTLFDIGFRPFIPGESKSNRLVLVFNRSDVPDAYGDCRRDARAGAAATYGPGFTVTATFCGGERPYATGHMEAPRVSADDPEGFANVMTNLLRAITRANGPLT
jgi:hypothetical protein